jgi:hypothetical protein
LAATACSTLLDDRQWRRTGPGDLTSQHQAHHCPRKQLAHITPVFALALALAPLQRASQSPTKSGATSLIALDKTLFATSAPPLKAVRTITLISRARPQADESLGDIRITDDP